MTNFLPNESQDESRINRFERKLDAIQDQMVKRDDFVRLIDKVDQTVPRTEFDSRQGELRALIDRIDSTVHAGFDAATIARDAAALVMKSDFDVRFTDHEGRMRGLEASRVPERVFMAFIALMAATFGVFGGKLVGH